MNLLETYAKRLSVADTVYKKDRGEALTESQKTVFAKVLNNTKEFLTESVATQRADIGSFKKFCLDVATVALPSLVATELVFTKAMDAMTGYVTYTKYVAGSNKGTVAQGDTFNSPFSLGSMTEGRINYTGSAQVEVASAGSAFTPAWKLLKGQMVDGSTAYDAKVVKTDTVDATGVATVTESFVNLGSDGTIPASSFPVAEEGHTVAYKVAYFWDIATIPASDIPTLNAKREGIALEAKIRKIKIEYDKLAAYQMKKENGVDLGQELASQAMGELTYEMDSEILAVLDKNAGDATAETTFNKTPNVGVALPEHYEGFNNTIENASTVIYGRTQRYDANYIVCNRKVLPILSLMRGWKASNAVRNGPFIAGSLNGRKVICSPILADGRFFVVYNGGTLSTAPAIFAPFMALVPTQALEYADGTNSQGFSTLYDVKMLNADLLVAGQVVEVALNSTNTSYSA